MKRRKKRFKKNVLRLFLCVILIAVVGFAGFKGYEYFTENDVNTKDNGKQNVDSGKDRESWPKTTKVSLIAGGDTVVHNDVANYAKKSDGTYDFNPFFSEIKDIITSYDIAYYNQETILGGKDLGYTFYPTFNTPSEFGEAMINTGFNMVSLATNHTYDRGEKAVINSINFWNNYKDVMTNGTALSEEERKDYTIMEKNGITYAMISYTYGLNGFKLPSGKDYLVNVYSDELAKSDIEALRDKVDVLIVAMHWGVEYKLTPTDEQKEQAKYLASLGVDVVIGNHPHCIEPVEWIDDTLIVYSLGNLISNQVILVNNPNYGMKVAIGALASMDFVKTEEKDGTKDVKIENVELDLVYTYKNTQNKYYKVIPFSKMKDDTYLKNYQSVYEEYASVLKKYDSNVNVVALGSR